MLDMLSVSYKYMMGKPPVINKHMLGQITYNVQDMLGRLSQYVLGFLPVSYKHVHVRPPGTDNHVLPSYL